MRHPDRAQLRARCEEILRELVEELDWGAARVEEHTQGWVNLCFEVGGEHIVRFNARDPHLPKFEREVAIFRDAALRQVLPLPQVCAYYPDRWEFPVLVTERMPGQNLEQQWHGLEPAQRELLEGEAGRLMGRMHAHPFTNFGEPHSPGSAPWRDVLAGMSQGFIEELREMGVIEPAHLREVERALERALPRIDTARPHLVHRDFHCGNMLFEEGRITALLDFEWSVLGDRYMDLRQWREGRGVFSNSDVFMAGYEECLEVDFAAHELELAVYPLLSELELSAVALKFFSAAEAAHHLFGIAQRLEALQALL